jgi:hypothetical protein
MKKSLFIIFLFLLLFQNSIAQKKDVRTLIRESKEAYEQEDFETSKNKILEAKVQFTSIPPPIVLSLEILSKAQIIKKDPLNNYSQIVDVRALASSYLRNQKSKKDNNYSLVQIENQILNTYPKDAESFLKIKQRQLEEENAKKTRDKEAAAKAVEIEKDQIIIREKNRIQDSINNEKDKIEKEKNRLIKEKIDEEKRKQDEIEQIAEAKRWKKINKRSSRSFSNIGFQSGEIAKYGLLYEHGGQRSIIGFHISARTSLTPDEDILNGTIIENKMEAEIGPNFRILKRLYLNFGVGYGFYKYVNHDDYLGTSSLDKKAYIASSAGVMVRIARFVNLNVGASFMDIHKEFYNPEITFGLSFNIKGSK